MTDATREALDRVDRILHEAGWDGPAESVEDSLTPSELARISQAYKSLLRPDHFRILTTVLKEGGTVEQGGREMGLNEGEARQLFREALHRLRDFVEVSEGHANESAQRVISGEAASSS